MIRRRKRFAVFASGRGTNMENLIRYAKRGALKAELALVFSDRSEAPALRKAQKAGIETLCLPPRNFPDKQAFESQLLAILREKQIDFIVLAGYMRILGSGIIRAYPGKILNVHPALLPAFRGATGIKDAFEYGARVTGVTVHLVDEEVDHGPIVLQKAVPVSPRDTLASLEKKIHAAEYKIYPAAVRLLASGKLKIHGRRVTVI
jgi:phosphoribosylglycinamide formyltransferase-1